MPKQNKILMLCLLIFVSLIMTGCAQKVAPPSKLESQINCPEPIENNSGEYMSPYTKDDVLAKWTDKAIHARTGAQAGKAIGTIAGQQAMKQVPIVGGFLGSEVGEAIGRKVAVESAGGMEYIKKTSDLSFNDLENMSLYLYVEHSDHEHYDHALKATKAIYPDLKGTYTEALQHASARIEEN